MSNHLDFTRGRVALAGIAVCFVLAVFLVVIPIAAKAAPVGLATAQPFVVLGGAGVTNTGPSVLNGDLGVTPGTSLSGFGAPAVVNGATHDNDAVAAQAQADLTTAYNVAAEQPIAPGNDLTGVDLTMLSSLLLSSSSYLSSIGQAPTLNYEHPYHITVFSALIINGEVVRLSCCTAVPAKSSPASWKGRSDRLWSPIPTYSITPSRACAPATESRIPVRPRKIASRGSVQTRRLRR